MKKCIILFLVAILVSSLAIAQTVPQNGLIAYYKFDEVGEFIVTDHSGNGFDGEIIGNAFHIEEGVVGASMYFDGIDAYVNCGLIFPITDQITLAAWVKPLDINDSDHSPWITKGDHCYALKNGAGSYFEFFIYDVTWHAPNITVDETYHDTWHHYLGTYDGVEIKMYIDGELLRTDPVVTTIQDNEFEVHLAHNSEQSTRYFNGELDEVLIYEAALMEEEVKALYDSYASASGSAVDCEETPVANNFALHQNYPNPFNPDTRIAYSLESAGNVTITVYDMLGKQIQTLVNEHQNAGNHAVTFDATDLASGIYYYKMVIGNQFVDAKKMALVR